MASHRFTVDSTLSVDDAFARTIDLTRVNEWDRGVTDAEQVTGDGPALGSRYQVTVTGFDGKPTKVVYELTEVDAPNRFVMIGENDQLRAHDTLEFAPADNGCVLTYVGTLEFLTDDAPLSDAELDTLFPKVAGVANAGLTTFLNPA